MREPCRVAVIGAGYTATEHVRAFADVPGVQIAGIFSRTRARAEKLAEGYPGAVVCDSVAELHARTQAHLVVVTVVELSMNAVSTACFEHPWTVLLEKPPGYDLDDALAIQRAARARDRRVFVALNRRTLSATIACKDGIAQSEGPRFIKVQDQQSQARALAGGQPQKVVDNWMFANSIHLVDYFRVFGRGQVVEVQPILPWKASGAEVVVTRLSFDSGDVGLYEGIWHASGPWAVSVTVPGRRWEMRPLEQAVTQPLGGPPEQLPIDERDTKFKPGFRLQAELAVAATQGGDPRWLPTLDEGLETMRLVDRMFPRAAAHDRR
jgi:predicted dehydrogenase